MDAAVDAADRAPLWLLTGMTNAGSGAALEALQRVGVDCVDNLPAALVDAYARMPRTRPSVALVDARQGDAVVTLTVPDGAHVLFLDADDSVLVRRQADTTRPHPCAAAGNGLAAISAERALLGSLRSVAEVVIDTGDLSPEQVGEAVVAALVPRGATAPPAFVCTVSSFGFKHGPQVEADWVVDVRFLPNPFWDDELRPLTGLDPRVRAYVLDGEDGGALVERLGSLLEWATGRAAAHGRARLHVAVGCTGGRHRSVAVAGALADRLRQAGLEVALRHRDVDRPDPR